jgi:hypothetical protein
MVVNKKTWEKGRPFHSNFYLAYRGGGLYRVKSMYSKAWKNAAM